MSKINHSLKNYISAKALATYKDLDIKEKNEFPKKLCLVSEKQNILKITLHQFIENQEKKHLSTNFNRKEVDTFLKEKDAAMEEITIDEDIQQIKEGEKNNVNNNDNIENNMNKINGEDNKSSHILIFKGTFGKDEYNRLVEKGEHKHHHHHHHHHHQHYNHNNNNTDQN